MNSARSGSPQTASPPGSSCRTRPASGSGTATPATASAGSSTASRCADWELLAFELTVDGDVVRGRGTTDDKGPVLIVLKTAQAFAGQEGGLPLNVKFLFEGEEEIGSPNLPAFLRRHAGELAADLVVSADGAMWRPTEPSVALASKGLVTLDVRGEGAHTHPHSGRYGGEVANPLDGPSAVLARPHDSGGTLPLAGFYARIP